MEIKIIKARKAHKDILKNLYVYYRYDLFLHTENDDSLALNKYGIVYGRKYRTHDSAMAEYDEIFNYPKKMFVYLMYVGKIPVGFAIILKPSAINKKVDYKLEEFFIVNRYRNKGFGEHVFCELIAKHKGKWELGILKENKAAITFWRKVITRNIGEYKKVVIPEDRKNDIPETVGFEFCSK
jgi:predicted acetyltransferase